MAMFKARQVAFVVLPLVLVSFLLSQSVTDLAKKEKERRAAVKGKPTSVVTNADLAKVKRKPAVEVAETDKTAADAQAAGETAAPAQKPAEQPPPEQQPAADQAAISEKDFKARLSELATKAQQAQEMIDLLTLKINSLWQEFYNMSDVKSREYTKFQISETYDKLTKAEAEAIKAKKDIDDFMATAKREGVPAIWIR